MHNADPNSQLAEQVGDDYHNADLTPKQVAMLDFAESLTLDPGNTKAEYVEELKSVGWADEDIVDIVHITCLFNYMDRLADGLGIELQPDRGWEPMLEKLSFKNDSTPKEFGKIAPAPAPEPVVPGDCMRVQVRKERRRANGWKFSGEAHVDGVQVAEASFSAMILDD